MKNWYITPFFTLLQLTNSIAAISTTEAAGPDAPLSPIETIEVAGDPVIHCAPDLTLNCGASTDPSNTGFPEVISDETFTLNHSDVLVSSSCSGQIQRTWTATTASGALATCTQYISLIDNTPPVIQAPGSALSNCSSLEQWIASTTDNCDPSPSVTYSFGSGEWISPVPCSPGMYRTQTQGGWGTNPAGNNPGTYLNSHFSQAFPNGLTIGCGNRKLTLTSAQAVRDFLPSGSSPSMLPVGHLINPGGTYNNVFAGQLVAATLSTTFDAMDEQFGSGFPDLGTLTIASGTFSGMTVYDLLTLANQIIGGCSQVYSPSQISSALASLNENFVDGTTNNGFIDCTGGLDCYLSTQITVTATDACGNSSTATFPLVLDNQSAPTFNGMHAELHVECGQIPSANELLPSGCFAELFGLTVTETLFSGACMPTIERVYALNNPCGLSASFTQYIFVHDTTPPQFLNQPENSAIQCGDPLPVFEPIVSDGCDVQPSVVFTESESIEGCTRIIQRTWTATDHCGNSSSVSQIISISDNDGPQVNGLIPELHIACGSIPSADEVSFSETCGAVVSVSLDLTESGSDCDRTITRTWTATDECGNTTVAIQHIYISDQIPPVITSVPAEITIECGSVLPEFFPQAIDNCSDVLIEYAQQASSEGGNCGQLLRTWTARDACGNEAVTSQLVTFTDTTPPVLSGLPNDVNASCGSMPAWPNVTATDNCDASVSVVADESFSQTTCGVIYTRTWTATDACGNTALAQQIIDLSDQSPPQFIGPAVLSLTCSEISTYAIEVTDDCTPDLSPTYSDNIISSGCTSVIERTWTTTDVCGNTSVFVQTIYLTDNDAPVFVSIPPSYSMSCGFDPLYESPVVVEHCSVGLDLNLVESQSSAGCTTEIIRTWTATDGCGNTSSAQQVITIADTQAPVLQGVPSGYQVSCSNYTYPEVPGNVMASDNCGTVEINFTEAQIPGSCPSAFQIVRTWSATDQCGNQSIAQQIIEVVDAEAPVFSSIPADFEATCGEVPAPPVLTATDNCSAVTISYNEQALSGGCPIIQRTWIASDACGNAASVVQRVFLFDDEPPLLQGIPPGGPVSCNNIPPVPDAWAVDNCDGIVDISINETIIGSGCEFMLIRTFIAEDDCGNSTVVSQMFQVTDEAPPVFINPQPSVTLQCSQIDSYQGPNVSDDCSNSILLTHSDVVNGAGCNYTILRTYTATDLCGNSASFTQTIHVVDTTPPVFSSVPLSTTVSCGAIPPPAQPVANDACSGTVPVQFTQQQMGAGCGMQIIRTWTASDACGNIATATQMILVTDLVAPVLAGVPASITLSCDQPVPSPAIVTATDNCALTGMQPMVIFSQTSSQIACGQLITRTWIANDACGNLTSATQTITIVDTQPPVFNLVPQDLTTSCNAIPQIPSISASDNCSSNVDVSFAEELVAGGCPYLIVRTWSATDDCGNASVVQQVITVNDDEAPFLPAAPADVTVSCSTVPSATSLIAVDNCAGEFVAALEETIVPGTCSYQIIRTWTAGDLCGNTSSRQQVITVTDNQVPVFSPSPLDLIVECGDDIEPFSPQISDCNAVEWEMSEYLLEASCASSHQIMQVWTATDACGNTSQVSRKVVFEDHDGPVLSELPEWVDVTCNEIPEIPEITASDACEGSVDVQFEETIEWLSDQHEGCTLTDATNFFSQMAVWLPNLPGLSDNWLFGPGGASMVRDEDAGTAIITGHVYNASNPSFGWNIYMVLANERSWTDWSSLTRSYKNDMNLAGTHYLNWSYFELQPGSSLTGTGALTGSTVQLTHAPWHYYYGFQLGMAANNRNANYGISGWFYYTGVINGTSRSGVGDLFADVSCCANHEIIRTWTAQDCAGNVTSYSQVISVSGNHAPSGYVQPQQDDPYFFNVTGTTDQFFTIQFEVAEPGRVSIQLFDEMGRILQEVFTGTTEAETRYVLRIPKEELPSGVYFFTFTHPHFRMVAREVVVR